MLPELSPAIEAAYGLAADVARKEDGDRYIADLFVSEPLRKHILALHAFNAEVARIRDVVSDPTLGEIRLQWWRDAIFQDLGGGNPVMTALSHTVRRFSLPVEAFGRLLDARVFDLYNDPMPTLHDLEGYAGETASSLFQFAAMILASGHDPGTAAAAGHAGVAYALTGLLRAFPRHVARRQCYLPQAMLASRGVDAERMFAGESSPELLRLLADLRTIARQHLAEAERELLRVNPELKPVFLPLALVPLYLDRMDRPGYEPFAGVQIAQWRRQWIVWKAAREMRA
jgi:15-cis-phytoene synthase